MGSRIHFFFFFSFVYFSKQHCWTAIISRVALEEFARLDLASIAADLVLFFFFFSLLPSIWDVLEAGGGQWQPSLGSFARIAVLFGLVGIHR
ncbi:hypothetical protein L209DRAFT_601437 [Thermothelomyces heterothallicus CBS 203.75]